MRWNFPFDLLSSFCNVAVIAKNKFCNARIMLILPNRFFTSDDRIPFLRSIHDLFACEAVKSIVCHPSLSHTGRDWGISSDPFPPLRHPHLHSQEKREHWTQAYTYRGRVDHVFVHAFSIRTTFLQLVWCLHLTRTEENSVRFTFAIRSPLLQLKLFSNSEILEDKRSKPFLSRKNCLTPPKRLINSQNNILLL